MIDESCIYIIKSKYDSFSMKEKKIADYILSNPSAVVTPTIDVLAEQIGISESTMVRFTRKLGYSGYQMFRISLARETVTPAEQVFETPISPEDDEVDIIFNAAISTLDETKKHIDRQAIKMASTCIVAENSLYFMGLGGSNIVSRDAFHKLIRTGIHCFFAEDFHMQLMQASQLTGKDVVLLTSHTGIDKDALSLAEEVKGRGATLIVLTSSPRSPLARKSDILLSVRVATATPVAESFTARIAQLMVIDTLYVEIMKLKDMEGVDHLQKMRDIIASRRV
ncbi:MAG: MurR/RpiR family transcriptional regulator [Sphaerochaetaceae bacterium]|nr:MurR/RpiR family transcriptional regulator [Sphaerochaetaceae bacterium]